MSNTNTGGPAFPQDQRDSKGVGVMYLGMTLRDYFAAKAMQSMLLTVRREQDVDTINTAAYRMADAMLKARGT